MDARERASWLLMVMVYVCVLGSRWLLPNLPADPCSSQTVAVAVADWLSSLSSVLLGGVASFWRLLFGSVPLTAWLFRLYAVLAVCVFAVVACFLEWKCVVVASPQFFSRRCFLKPCFAVFL